MTIRRNANEAISGVLKSKKKQKRAFVAPTEANVYRDALCFMVKTWARYKTTVTGLNNGWWLAVVDNWQLVVGGGWRHLAVGGGW